MKLKFYPDPQLAKDFFHLISSKRNYFLYIIKNCKEVVEGKIWACYMSSLALQQDQHVVHCTGGNFVSIFIKFWEINQEK